MDALVIVAHPDDEVIWCGGLLLRRPRWRWLILSLCRAGDPDRAPRFGRVCGRLGVEGIMEDLDDGNPLAELDGPRDIAPLIRRLAAGRRWDLCLTHGANGEYGHPRHRQVHAEVVRLVRRGELACRRLWTFAVQCRSDGQCTPLETANRRLRLSAQELAAKRRIVRELYGFAEDSFEVRACSSPESFATAAGVAAGRSGKPLLR
jgi:LmbE family N-acetylglucosaminyl deacetylase